MVMEEIINGKYYNYLTYEDFLAIINEMGGYEVVEFYNAMSVLKREVGIILY